MRSWIPRIAKHYPRVREAHPHDDLRLMCDARIHAEVTAAKVGASEQLMARG